MTGGRGGDITIAAPAALLGATFSSPEASALGLLHF